MQLQLRVSSLFRDLSAETDDGLGERLVEMVRRASDKAEAPPAVAVVRGERLDVVGLAPIVEKKIRPGTFVAGLTRAEMGPSVGDPLAVGIIGTVGYRPPGAEARVPMVMVFLEWEDCRWWHWKALLDPATGDIRPETETWTCAVEGDPMPQGLGRWWSLGRRMTRRMQFDRWPEAPLVH